MLFGGITRHILGPLPQLGFRLLTYLFYDRSQTPHSADHPPRTYVPRVRPHVSPRPARQSRRSHCVRPARRSHRVRLTRRSTVVGPPCTTSHTSVPPCTSHTSVHRARPARRSAVYIHSPYALAHFSVGVVQYLNCAQILKG